MATLAEQLIGGVQQGIAQTGQNINTGAELAQHVQNIASQRAQIDNQKQQLQLQKISKVGDLYEKAGQLEGPAQKFMFDKAIPNTIKALGVDDYYPESTQAMFKSNPAFVGFIKGEIEKDPNKGTQLFQAMADPSGEQLSQLFPEASKFGAIQDLQSELQVSPKALNEAMSKGLAMKNARDTAAMRTGTQEERVVEGTHNAAIHDLTNPTSLIQKKLGAYQTIDNALAAFRAAPSVQEFEQLQTQLRLNQGATGGRTGVNERADAHASDLGISRDKYIQIATGNLQDVNLSSPGIVKAIQDVAQTELGQIKTQGVQAIDNMAKGKRNFYTKHPEKAADYSDVARGIKDQFSSTQMESPAVAAFKKLSPAAQDAIRKMGKAPAGM